MIVLRSFIFLGIIVVLMIISYLIEPVQQGLILRTLRQFDIVLLAIVPIAIGLIAFSIRTRFRLTYGIIELCVAFFATTVTLGTFLMSFLEADFDKRSLAWLQLGLIVYVYVRAFDNINEGLKRHPRLYSVWKRLLALETRE